MSFTLKVGLLGLRVVIGTPSITSPTSGQTNFSATGPFVSSSFTVTSGSDTHASSDWQFATDSGFTSVVHQSLGNTSALTSYSPPANALNAGTSYFVRVRHNGASGASSLYSAGVGFTTPLPRGSQTFTSPGVTSFVVPAGVTQISAVAIGGGGSGSGRSNTGQQYETAGGGGGGGLAYATFSVTPGETLTVVVGAGGALATGGSQGNPGGVSRVHRSGTNLVRAGGGAGGTFLSGGNGGNALTGSGNVGGRGGDSPQPPAQDPQTVAGYGPGGGGGAAGYTGAGGSGSAMNPATLQPNDSGAGAGGGASGGLAQRAQDGSGGGGGGVGVLGQGADGASLNPFSFNRGAGGFGGSGGGDGLGGTFSSNGGDGGAYGGGGGGQSVNTANSGLANYGGPGGGGAVRLVWPGQTRQYPNTDVSTN